MRAIEVVWNKKKSSRRCEEKKNKLKSRSECSQLHCLHAFTVSIGCSITFIWFRNSLFQYDFCSNSNTGEKIYENVNWSIVMFTLNITVFFFHSRCNFISRLNLSIQQRTLMNLRFKEKHDCQSWNRRRRKTPINEFKPFDCVATSERAS